jgi:hypothetical protein
MRISRRVGAASVARLDPEALGAWRRFYGDTLAGRGQVVAIEDIEEGSLVS